MRNRQTFCATCPGAERTRALVEELADGAKVVPMGAPGSGLAKPALLQTLLAQARLAVRLVREPAVPMLTKAVLATAALYLIWPLDFLPDLLPVLGQLDDLGVVLAALELFLRLCPDAPQAFHREAMGAGRRYSPMPPQSSFVDVEFRRE